MMTLSGFIDLVSALIRDDSAVLTPFQLDTAAMQALQRYSIDAPYLVSELVTCDGLLAPLPSTWQPGISQLKSAVALTGGVTPEVVQQKGVAGDQLHLDRHFTGALMLEFSLAHQLDESHDTVFYGDMEALACYAAAICCDQLAAYYINEANSTLSVDVTAHQSKSNEYRKQATAYRTRYNAHVGQKTPGSTAAGAVVSFGSRRRK
jgi:hypothetical protein